MHKIKEQASVTVSGKIGKTGKFLFACLFVLLITLSATAVRATDDIDDEAPQIDFALEVESCAKLEDRVTRLICYDRLARKAGFMPSAEALREADMLETIGFWDITRRKTSVGEEVTYLKNDALDKTKSGDKSTLSRPMLIIKCKYGMTDVYIDFNSSLFEKNIPPNTNATLPLFYKLDNLPKKSTHWDVSTDKQALFAPLPVDFIKEIRTHKTLIFQTVLSDGSFQTIVHNLSGIDAALDILVERCYNTDKP